MHRTKRNFGLDVLRAAAIMEVFLAHELNINVGRVNLLSAFNRGVELCFVFVGVFHRAYLSAFFPEQHLFVLELLACSLVANPAAISGSYPCLCSNTSS